MVRPRNRKLRDRWIRASSVKRHGQSQRWDKHMITNMQGTPQQPDPSMPGLHMLVRIRMDPPVEVNVPDLRLQREEDMPKGAYIKKRHFEGVWLHRRLRRL